MNNQEKQKKAFFLWQMSFILKLILVIISLTYFVVYFNELSLLNKSFLVSSCMLGLHQIEEHHFPGDFVWMFNYVKSKGDTSLLDRYPMCILNDMIVDSVGDIIYLIAVFASIYINANSFLNIVITMLCIFGICETVIHSAMGVVLYIKLRNKGKNTIYNPGAMTCWIGLFPAGISAINAVISTGIISGIQWIYVFALLILFAVCVIAMPENLIMDKESPYFFNKGSFEGYFKKYI